MKMKKLLKKAVVFAVAASMLVATPLTASAGLNGVYSVSDGDKQIGENPDASHTGTVTSTDTNTTVLQDYVDAKIIGIVLDQSTVNTWVGVAVEDRPQLTATVVLDGKVIVKDEKSGEDKDITEDVVKQLSDQITWKVTKLDGTTDPNISGPLNQTLSITAEAGNRSVVTLNPRKGTVDGNLLVTASIGGLKEYAYDICDEEGNVLEHKTVEWDDTREVYSASAEVFIKEYAGWLTLEKPETQFVKHTLDMNDYLIKLDELGNVSKTVNDTVTWSIVPNVKGAATITDAGIVTIKKYDAKKNAADNYVTVTAVSERGKTAETTFLIDPGIAATKVEIRNADETVEGKEYPEDHPLFNKNKADTDFADEDGDPSINVVAVMYGKAANNKEKNKVLYDGETYTAVIDGEEVPDTKFEITDVVTWTSNKTNILTVSDNGDGTIKLTPVSAGTAKVTAKTSSGKSANLTVTVKATLTEISIDDIAFDPVYSGQSVQLTVTRTSGNYDVTTRSTEGLKWSITKVLKTPNVEGSTATKANPNASINAKGVLTVKNKIDAEESYKEVEVVVEAKTSKIKDEDGNLVSVKAKKIISVDQSSINRIHISDDAGILIAQVDAGNSKYAKQIDSKLNTTNISVPKNREYTATVEATSGDESTLTWKTSSAKIATVEPNGDGTAKIKAVGKGKATITVSGINVTNNKAKVVKTTFKVDVKQPVTSLTLNKTSVVLKDTGKAQNVSFSVKANKNATASVTWSVVQKNGDSPNVTIADSKAKNGKLVLPVVDKVAQYKAGDVFVVTAKDNNTGVTASATIKVVSPSTAVTIWDPETKAEFTYNNAKGNPVKNATEVKLGKSVTLQPKVNVGTKTDADWVAPGANGDKDKSKVAAGVTYTVNKKGIVTIEGNTVTRVKAGSVTITVKTEDNKSYKLKID